MYEFEERLANVARAQTELLAVVHRTSLDVVAARKRVEERIEDLEESERRVAEQHAAAAEAGEEQAELLGEQSARIGERIRELREDLDGLLGAEELLGARAALMQDQIADFRNTMTLVAAKVVAARTSAVAAEALDTLRDALTYIEFVVAEPSRLRTDRRGTVRATAAAPPPAGKQGQQPG